MVVTGCPCGEQHEMGPVTKNLWDEFVAPLGPTVVVTTLQGSWHVPRIYIAFHGLKGNEIPVIAGRYGFREA